MVASGNAWGFVAEAHAQSVAVSSGPDADEDQAFVNDLSGAWLLQHRLSERATDVPVGSGPTCHGSGQTPFEPRLA